MITVTEYAKKAGISRQRVLKLLSDGRVPGAEKKVLDYGPTKYVWMIPEETVIEPRISGRRKKAGNTLNG